ncbi:MAG: protein phosphatase 2C domain-containing protein, partial [bacterium]|nr:protein phosphatase 2C domain-containing protein [bacterium]
INQDFVLINEKENIYIIADGMGGHLSGEVASHLACSTIEEYLLKHKKKGKSYPKLINKAIKEANKTIWEASAKEIDNRGMGTTVTLLMFISKNIILLKLEIAGLIQ